MANNTIYPFGPGGQTPTTIPIADDLATERADEALSAKQGVVLNGKVIALSELTAALGFKIDDILKKAVYKSNDVLSDIEELEALLVSNVSSITATYTQSGVVFDKQILDDLRANLVVTAHLSDGTDMVVSGYTLSGTLTAGTSTITVSYQNCTDTFNVTVTACLYYRAGSQCIKAAILTAAKSNSFTHAVVDGVTLYYTRTKNNAGNTLPARYCYPYFDFLLTKGTNYVFEIKTSGLPSGAKINFAFQYHNQAFKTDGDANNYVEHSSDMMDSGWQASTGNNGVFSVTYGSATSSSTLALIGARVNIQLTNSSGTEIEWGDATVDYLVIKSAS